MRCALCPNEESLLIQVQAGSGLSLMLCPACEDTPIFEVAARLAAENEKLREQVEKMRCCMNCKHDINKEDPKSPCRSCRNRMNRPKWELAT